MSEVFDEAFPNYLAMGMTYEQFWEMDSTLVIPYRKAYQIQQEQANRLAWLQGMYIYEALCDVAPVLHAFAKSGTTVRPYSEKPYEFMKPVKKKDTAENNKVKMQNAADHMARIAMLFNNKKRKEEEEKGNSPERSAKGVIDKTGDSDRSQRVKRNQSP